MITLSKSDTLKILALKEKNFCLVNKYQFTTRFSIQCLGCLKQMFITFQMFDTRVIFCKDCKKKARFPNIVQMHYIRIIKEKQLNTIEKLTNSQILL